MISEVEDFLVRVKALIKSNKRRFIIRRDRDYRQDLLDLGLAVSLDNAWDTLLQLDSSEQTKPPEEDEDGSGKLVWFFQKTMPNGVTAYIKLKIDSRGCVCISFHPVRYGRNTN